jgi:hypothetical protein
MPLTCTVISRRSGVTISLVNLVSPKLPAIPLAVSEIVRPSLALDVPSSLPVVQAPITKTSARQIDPERMGEALPCAT